MTNRRIPAKIFENHFINTGRIFLWGEIEEQITEYVIKSMRWLLDKEIPSLYLYISSNGGCSDCCAAIIDEMNGMKSVGVTVHTIAQGKAYSAAANILVMGTKGCRFATKHATIMIHPISYALEQDYAEQQKRCAEFVEKQCDYTSQLIAKACGKSGRLKYRKFLEDINKGLWLTAIEAKRFGAIDDIWDWKMESKVIIKT